MNEKDKFNVILTKEDLIKDFKKCGLSKGQSVIVHTSLSSLGYVVGGAEVLIRALLEIVGTEGTIMMPTQTWKNLDPEKGVHFDVPERYHDIIRKHWPAYDKRITPPLNMGKAAEMLAFWPGVERSDHPARSFACVGKNAKYITENHDLSNIFGIGSPLHKLYELNGKILLIGVGYNKNTCFHLAESIADFKSKKFTVEHSAIMINGKREYVAYKTQDVDDCDFIKIGEDYDKDANVKVHKIGNADVRFLDVRNIVDYTIKWMEKNRK